MSAGDYNPNWWVQQNLNWWVQQNLMAQQQAQDPFNRHLAAVKPGAITRALGQVFKDGPCEIPNCFVCEPKP